MVDCTIKGNVFTTAAITERLCFGDGTKYSLHDVQLISEIKNAHTTWVQVQPTSQCNAS